MSLTTGRLDLDLAQIVRGPVFREGFMRVGGEGAFRLAVRSPPIQLRPIRKMSVPITSLPRPEA